MTSTKKKAANCSRKLYEISCIARRKSEIENFWKSTSNADRQMVNSESLIVFCRMCPLVRCRKNITLFAIVFVAELKKCIAFHFKTVTLYINSVEFIANWYPLVTLCYKCRMKCCLRLKVRWILCIGGYACGYVQRRDDEALHDGIHFVNLCKKRRVDLFSNLHIKTRMHSICCIKRVDNSVELEALISIIFSRIEIRS